MAFAMLCAGCGPELYGVPDYENAPEPEPASGADEPAEAAPAPRRRAVRTVARPFLWRIESGAQPSFLFGTMHSGVTFDEALPANHLDAVANARLVFMEVDPRSDIDELALVAALDPNERITDFVNPVAWNQITNELLHEVNIVRLRQLRPWVTMIFLTRARTKRLRGGEAAHMDQTLYDFALRQEIELRYLETMEERAEALGATSDQDMGRVVSDMVGADHELDTELEALLDAYYSGNEAVVEQLVHHTEDPSLRAFNRALFDGRNERWMEVLTPELGEGGVLVAVGVGHLLGQRGLVARLREAGHAVTRVD